MERVKAFVLSSHDGAGGAHATFSNVRRRTLQTMRGGASETDTAYVAEYTSFTALRATITDVKKSLAAHNNALQVWVDGTVSLADQLASAVPSAGRATSRAATLVADAPLTTAVLLLGGLAVRLEDALSRAKGLDAPIATRAALLLDVTSRSRTVESLSIKPSTQAARLAHKQEKLSATSRELESQTRELLAGFTTFSDEANATLRHAADTLGMGLSRFLGESAKLFGGEGAAAPASVGTLPGRAATALIAPSSGAGAVRVRDKSVAFAEPPAPAPAPRPPRPPRALPIAAAARVPDELSESLSSPLEWVVTHGYTAASGDELTLVRGDKIHVTVQYADGWARGTINDRTGVFPVNHARQV